MSLKAPKPPSKIDDICRFLAEVDDDLDVPDWGWNNKYKNIWSECHS